MEVLGRIEFRPIMRPAVGMLVAYRGEYNNNVKLAYEIVSLQGQNDICLKNDFLEISEIFSVKNTELQEIVCTFDVPTSDINLEKTGIYRKYKVEHLLFGDLEELTYIMTNNLEEVQVWYKNGAIELMGKQHISPPQAPNIKEKAIPPAQEVLDLLKQTAEHLGFSPEGMSPLMMMRTAVQKLQAVNYIPYPVSLSTVDIVPYYINKSGTIFILMGRKPGQTKYQFIGGFRDPAEVNEEAASRELNEEACIDIDVKRFKYQQTMFIDDRRYKESVHKVTTALFTVEITQDEMESAEGCDDIEEIRNFTLNSLIENKEELIRDVHHNIFDKIVAIFS